MSHGQSPITTTDDIHLTVISGGTGSKDVTLMYRGNEGPDAKTADIIVSTTADVPVKSYTIKFKQSAPGAVSTEVTDVLTAADFVAKESQYTEFSGVQITSSAVYAGKTATSYDAIQMRSSGSDCGIVTTASGGNVRKITITWNSNTSSSRQFDIYGSNEPFESAKDMYNTSLERIGTLNFGETDFEVTGDYQYIGFRSRNGAMYLDKIEIVWEE